MASEFENQFVIAALYLSAAMRIWFMFDRFFSWNSWMEALLMANIVIWKFTIKSDRIMFKHMVAQATKFNTDDYYLYQYAVITSRVISLSCMVIIGINRAYDSNVYIHYIMLFGVIKILAHMNRWSILYMLLMIGGCYHHDHWWLVLSSFHFIEELYYLVVIAFKKGFTLKRQRELSMMRCLKKSRKYCNQYGGLSFNVDFGLHKSKLLPKDVDPAVAAKEKIEKILTRKLNAHRKVSRASVRCFNKIAEIIKDKGVIYTKGGSAIQVNPIYKGIKSKLWDLSDMDGNLALSAPLDYDDTKRIAKRLKKFCNSLKDRLPPSLYLDVATADNQTTRQRYVQDTETADWSIIHNELHGATVQRIPNISKCKNVRCYTIMNLNWNRTTTAFNLIRIKCSYINVDTKEKYCLEILDLSIPDSRYDIKFRNG